MTDASAACPYCGATLPKKPKAKTRCSACGQYMRVRYIGSDPTGVVVTQDSADEIDLHRWALYEARDGIGHDDVIEAERGRLTAKFGIPPSDGDVYWGICNRRRVDAARKGEWDVYRNITFTMAMILAAELRLAESTRLVLQVCYCDLCQRPPFNVLAGGVIDALRRVAARAGADDTSLRSMFSETAPEIAVACWQAARPEAVWPRVESALADEAGERAP